MVFHLYKHASVLHDERKKNRSYTHKHSCLCLAISVCAQFFILKKNKPLCDMLIREKQLFFFNLWQHVVN